MQDNQGSETAKQHTKLRIVSRYAINVCFMNEDESVVWMLSGFGCRDRGQKTWNGGSATRDRGQWIESMSVYQIYNTALNFLRMIKYSYWIWPACVRSPCLSI